MPHLPHRVYFTEAQIKDRVMELGRQVTADYQGKDLVVVTVLKGSILFSADLLREIRLPLSLDFLGCRSYGDATESSGVVQITQDLSRSIEGKDVLIVEDIVDTGLTMKHLLELLGTRKPRSIKLASLLHKPSRSKVNIPIDYLGFTIEDVFIVGYGLDYKEECRNWPFLAVLSV